MRTTIDLPDQLFRQLKSAAALKGVTLKGLITQAVARELTAGTEAESGKRVRLPLVPSKRPGTLNVTSERLADILEQEDLDGSSRR